MKDMSKAPSTLSLDAQDLEYFAQDAILLHFNTYDMQECVISFLL